MLAGPRTGLTFYDVYTRWVLANIVNILFDPICAKEATTQSKSRELSHDATAPLSFLIYITVPKV